MVTVQTGIGAGSLLGEICKYECFKQGLSGRSPNSLHILTNQWGFIFWRCLQFIYCARFCYKDVSMLLMSGWMFDSLLCNIHYMGQKQSLQNKVCGNIYKQTTPVLLRWLWLHVVYSKIYPDLFLHRQPTLWRLINACTNPINAN